ncbi:UV-stimulated scaffold protein A isoform X1 [Synchiropus splendidus]|uniref:UV-stimulated scaffold protein A isoform X1 n=1 Tax=Synchiropus splendidus TaxID=270530 RepID=UPI00237DBA81|nr:UV-stimulated scaffold protein A isoform X1 [Synchiropus splendidus]XP_053734996.1 UV-stimulated scaffold protein A isoform X1 [Synchiropus splendidus]XP_053734997.1 UV-stimulated scaffold protein A isoform X1 [Synchiropus splendidus]XP_053734998.1 UV-stimulated scaffold protein A isoform X1 [Synchiropus splendidus]XP_053734999.1 UV-stimulated scaffold protein A isoform X1 [Synchiropus splendidus]
MELSQRERLSQLVEVLTTSGDPQLNQHKMKEVKKICKESNDCIDHVYHLVMSQLNEDHAEIRLSAFQIASELFSRSHHFRTLVVDNFQDFLDLTVETDTEQPLPPPKPVAKKLRSLAIQTVQSWQASYGSAYKKLALGYHFLKQVKKVDFDDAEARTIAERRREEERQRKMERIYKERVEAATKDMEESYEDIQSSLTEMESCMMLLLPKFDSTDVEGTSSGLQKAEIQVEPKEEAPCCSKDLRTDREEVRVQEDLVAGEVKTEITEKNEETKEEGEDSGTDGEDEDSFIRNSGLISHSYNLDLKLSPGIHVNETEDNEAVVSTVIDLHRLITNKHLPAVQGWVQVFTKSGADQQLLRRALDLKTSIEAALQKHKELHIDYKTRIRKVITASSDDEEDEFDEVPEKEGYEPHIPDHLRAEYGLDPSPSTSNASVFKKTQAKLPASPKLPASLSSRKVKRQREEEADPTCAAATVRVLKEQLRFPTQPISSTGPSSNETSSAQKTTDAPVVPFGLDLYYWGEELPNAGKIIKSSSQHQFWVPAEVVEEVDNPDLLAESRSRYITFPGKFSPVSHYCHAPLGDGRLCQRQDRVKCPFHGRIVPRDHEGRPCKQEDRLRLEEEERRRREEQPDWRDPELMRDIEAATGEDLGSDRVGKKGKGKAKKKYPNLSDLKQSANTSRSRLEKRVFNKSSMRRVAQMMSKADSRKHDKFSNQFNYALN